MRIKVVDAPVRQNVEIFLEILRRVHQKKGEAPLPADRLFLAWIDRHSGHIAFDEAGKAAKAPKKASWKPVEIAYHYDPQKGEILFTIAETEGKSAEFHTDDLRPIAFRIMKETLKVFNEVCKRLQGPSPLETKIAVISKLEVDATEVPPSKNVVIGTWHAVDRQGAEELLFGKPVGTYLFRKDPYAQILEEQLCRQLHKEIKCITLTYSEPHHKITDLTLVHVDSLWQVYDDDPSLTQHAYEDLNMLLSALKGALKFPLWDAA